jgi:ABC-type glycerol-3-phosphate transport system substrate-binding protein
VVPLDSFIKQDKSVHVKDYYSVALAMWQASGKQIALPRDIAPSNIIYYNRSLLQAAGSSDPPDGWSTSDFLKMLAKLHTAGQSYPPSDGRHWAYTDTSAVQGLLAFIYLFGGRLTGAPSQPNTVTIDRPQAVAGARFYVDLYRQGYAEAPLLRDQESQLADFLTGTIPLLLSDPSLIPTMQHVKHPLDWDITMLPLQQGVQQVWTGVGFSASLTKVCTQPDAAWDLIRYLIQGEGMKLRAGYGDVHPAYKPIANSSTYLTKLPPRGKRLFNTIGMQYMLPSLPVTADLSFFFRSPTVAGSIDYRAMGFSLNEDLTSVLQGNMSVSAALQDAARAAKTPAS